MPRFKFKINELEYRTVDAFDLDDALQRTGIDRDDPYEMVEGDDFDENCLISTLTDEILFGL
jgi:hypothetical protein